MSCPLNKLLNSPGYEIFSRLFDENTNPQEARALQRPLPDEIVPRGAEKKIRQQREMIEGRKRRPRTGSHL